MVASQSGEWYYSYDFPSDFITLDLIMANTLIIMQQSKTVSWFENGDWKRVP